MGGRVGSGVPVLVFDSMQVYGGLPVVTNQARVREADLLGVCSVIEDWTVARHVSEANRVLGRYDPGHPFVLDAGTGMYLNAMLFDIELSPSVPPEIREEAFSMAAGAGNVRNVRREARRIELSLAGVSERGSIWEGGLRFDTTLIYLRPEMGELEKRISVRSSRIVSEGLIEVENLLSSLPNGSRPNASVSESIGFKELKAVLDGELSIGDAEERIRVRTRKLARRQMRWFDKLAYILQGRADIQILKDQKHDIKRIQWSKR